VVYDKKKLLPPFPTEQPMTPLERWPIHPPPFRLILSIFLSQPYRAPRGERPDGRWTDLGNTAPRKAAGPVECYESIQDLKGYEPGPRPAAGHP
jgi:hypothetical protein